MLDLFIIIVNYNTRDFLKRCLMSIKKNVSEKIKYEIIIVDNASTDGSPSEISNLKSQISNLKIILNRENLGFSKANNQGIKIMQDNRYVLFLNPDTIIQKNTIEQMLKFMDSHKDAGASTCKLVMLNGEVDDASHRGFPTPWNSFSHFSGLSKLFPKSKLFAGYNLGWMDMNKTHEIDALTGAFMLVRREAGQEAGWWDEDYFFYGEDIEFCYQLKQIGWKIYYVPEVSTAHFKGVSSGIKGVSKQITTASQETKRKATRQRFNAMRIFYNKHYKEKYPAFVSWLVDKGISVKERLSGI